MSIAAVFFDIDVTLGFDSRDSSGTGIRCFALFPKALEMLRRLRPLRFGILAAGDRWSPELAQRAIAISDLAAELTTNDLILHWAKDSRTQFEWAAAQASATPADCVFVSRNAARRRPASEAGMRVERHLYFVGRSISTDPLVYVRATGSIDELRRLVAANSAIVPFHLTPAPKPTLTPAGKEPAVVYAIAPKSSMAQIAAAPLKAEELRERQPDESSPYLMRARDIATAGAEAIASTPAYPGSLITAADSAVLFAMPDDAPPPEPVGNSHCGGDLVKLRVTPEMLSEITPSPSFADFPLTHAERDAFRGLDSALLHRYLIPWWGGFGPWYGASTDPHPIASRYYSHPDNRVAVDRATNILKELCASDHTRRPTFPGPGGAPLENVEADIVGSTHPNEIVVVAAHLDSINRNETAQNKSTGVAPGVDDDASGVAGVLASAHVLRALSRVQPPKRTIRFVLFNAEENQIVGSLDYVRWRSPPLTFIAMLQMDMIGFVHEYPPHICEVHSGGNQFNEHIEKQSAALGLLFQQTVAVVSPALTEVQRYPPDIHLKDVGGTSSDDKSFRSDGCPACHVCENFYFDCCISGTKPHPTYHTELDVSVNSTYAADIARAVAATAWKVANS